MAKATITIRQELQYQPHQACWFAATAALFNRVAAFYFEVIQAHEKVLELSSKEALTALEQLTHRTRANPNPVVPLSEIAREVPAMFRRAAIHAALGSAHSFSTHLKKWFSVIFWAAECDRMKREPPHQHFPLLKKRVSIRVHGFIP